MSQKINMEGVVKHSGKYSCDYLDKMEALYASLPIDGDDYWVSVRSRPLDGETIELVSDFDGRPKELTPRPITGTLGILKLMSDLGASPLQILDGARGQTRINKVDSDSRLLILNPDDQMRNLLLDPSVSPLWRIFQERRELIGIRAVIVYTLYGVEMPRSLTPAQFDQAVLNLTPTDFGFTNVQRATKFVMMVREASHGVILVGDAMRGLEDYLEAHGKWKRRKPPTLISLKTLLAETY